MSHFSWLASFDADCPLCGEHMPANVKHECFPQSALNTPDPTLGKALAASLRCPCERLNEGGICHQCGADRRGI